MPDAFAELAPFADWALEPERARIEKKAASSMEEIRAFYDAMMLRMDEVLAYLDDDFGGDLPTAAHRLYLMSLSLVEVATLVELYKRRESIHACDPLRFVPQR
ncbi:MAG: hypothetical protein OXI22_01975 [Defluviicoccus sp.]|nr:hypothetical protein [Defluviicoccus sp.]MDE0382631.1 hypothetical protein [Defluviicoccus sp.]